MCIRDRLTAKFNGEHDPSQPRYARVPVGPTCAFCILMASRGFVYWSEEKAGGRDNRYHKNDDCRIVSSWGEAHVKGYDPEGMKARYLQCRKTIAGMLNRDEYGKYVARMKMCIRDRRIPVDEVKAIILQAHPAPPQPKRPEFLEPRYAPEKPAGIGDNRRES